MEDINKIIQPKISNKKHFKGSEGMLIFVLQFNMA